MKPTAGLIALALLTSGAPSLAQAQADGALHPGTLSLSASGEVHAAPDLAVITAGVSSQAPTAAAAMARNREGMTAALTALRARGVAERDIQTTSLSLQPQYVFKDGEPRRLTGYQADNAVSVRLHDLRAVGATADALVAAGANQITSISFEIADRQPLEDAARRAAVKALEAKADLYAQASGYRLGRLLSLSEGDAPARPGPLPMFRMAAEAASPTPVAPGELTVTATVMGQYELTR